jgi:hypothetical protein
MSAIGEILRLLGTASSFFHVGGPKGPAFKRNGTALEARTFDDAAFAVLRGATPIADNDVATKQYVDTGNKPVTVTAQFDGNNALPANTVVEHLYVVTTTGPNATIGQLLFDDGSNAGIAQVLAAIDGRSVFTTAAFAGGTITLEARAYYTWSVGAAAWQLETTPQIAGAVREIRYAIGTAGTQDSAAKVPANAIVVACQVRIVTPFTGGTGIEVGRAGSLALLVATTENAPTIAGLYDVPQDTSWGGAALAVRTTVIGGPVAGAGFTIVRYTEPNL